MTATPFSQAGLLVMKQGQQTVMSGIASLGDEEGSSR